MSPAASIYNLVHMFARHWILLIAGLLAAPSFVLDAASKRAVAAAAAVDVEEVAPPSDGKVVEVSILKLRAARYRPGQPLPKWIADLDGKRVRIWGHMAIGTLEGLETFELVPESCECNRSKLNHFVDVTLTEGQTRFIPGRITLEGTFYAGEKEEDGFVTSLYRLTTTELPR